MATHSIIPVWEIHGQKSLADYSPWGCKRVGHDFVLSTHIAQLFSVLSLSVYMYILTCAK